jgi:hypothetical protein
LEDKVTKLSNLIKIFIAVLKPNYLPKIPL